MNKRVLLFLFSISLFNLCACDNKKEEADKVKANRLDTLFNELFEEGKFNGNVLIAENGKAIYEKSFGLANEKSKQQLNIETRFELASVSKQFTAMGIVQLQKENKLSYQDDFSKYIPELAFYKGISIHDLLIHTSGLVDYMELAIVHWDKSKIADNEDMIQLFEKVKPELEFKPGEKFRYSNTGYMLLATIIERVSGKSFEGYLKEKIFDPLQMTNTFVYRRWYQPEELDNYAQGYIYSDSLHQIILPYEANRKTVYLDGIVGDGIVNSNLHDLLRWDRALYGDDLVNDEDKKIVFSSYKLNDRAETKYGYGWQISNSKVYGKRVAHAGSWAGYETYIERHLDKDKTIIILQNHSTPKTEIPSSDICKILYNQAIEKEIHLDAAILKRYSGLYENEKGKEYHLQFKEKQLFFLPKPEIDLRLIPVSKTKFIVDRVSPELTFTFILNEKGEVEKCRFIQVEKKVDRELTRQS